MIKILLRNLMRTYTPVGYLGRAAHQLVRRLVLGALWVLWALGPLAGCGQDERALPPVVTSEFELVKSDTVWIMSRKGPHRVTPSPAAEPCFVTARLCRQDNLSALLAPPVLEAVTRCHESLADCLEGRPDSHQACRRAFGSCRRAVTPAVTDEQRELLRDGMAKCRDTLASCLKHPQ